jgi:hypothetical protein
MKKLLLIFPLLFTSFSYADSRDNFLEIGTDKFDQTKSSWTFAVGTGAMVDYKSGVPSYSTSNEFQTFYDDPEKNSQDIFGAACTIQ